MANADDTNAPTTSDDAAVAVPWQRRAVGWLKDAALFVVILAVGSVVIGKLRAPDLPEVAPDFALVDVDGQTHRLSDLKGKKVVLNFWATWCAPCRKEMPQLAELQEEFGGEDFEVLTLATGRNSPAGIKKFFADNGITNLPRHQDPKQAVAREMAVLGLPITVILDRDGKEIARLRGDAEWNSDSAKAIIAALIAEG